LSIKAKQFKWKLFNKKYAFLRLISKKMDERGETTKFWNSQGKENNCSCFLLPLTDLLSQNPTERMKIGGFLK